MNRNSLFQYSHCLSSVGIQWESSRKGSVKMCKNAFVENLLKSNRTPVGTLLDSWNLVGILLESGSLVGIHGGVKSTAFCLKFLIPLTPTPQILARYFAYTSKYIASAPKYLTGAQHFLKDIYPEFDTNRAHPLVQSTICGSKKIRANPIHRKQPLCLSHLEAFGISHIQHMPMTTSSSLPFSLVASMGVITQVNSFGK